MSCICCRYTVIIFFDNSLLILLKHRVQVVEGKGLLSCYLLSYFLVVPVEPHVAELDRLRWVHLHEVADVLEDQVPHLLDRYPVRHSFLLEEPVFTILIFI